MITAFRKTFVFALLALPLAGVGVGLLVWAGLLGCVAQAPMAPTTPDTEEVACLGYVDAEYGVAALDARAATLLDPR